MKIAADMCIYTNDNFTVECIAVKLPASQGESGAVTGASGPSYP